jgi:hypothetical protein
MSSAFGAVNATSQVSRSGYLYQIYLPAATVGGATAGIAEDPLTGGKLGGPFPDSDNGEVLWCCYAWPIQVNQTGNRVFFVNQEGDLLQMLNRQALPYTTTATGPAFDAVFAAAGDMGSPLGINGIASNDGFTWAPVQ